MSDREFFKFFSGLLGALVALAVVLFIVAHALGGKSSKMARAEQGGKATMVADAIAERIKPVGSVTVAAANAAVNAIIPAANAADGKGTYEKACAACHAAGVAGAPKFGDHAAWKDRIAQGNAKLYEHALKGFQGKKGFMPAKGGNASLSDADVKAAVDYMVSKGK